MRLSLYLRMFVYLCVAVILALALAASVSVYVRVSVLCSRGDLLCSVLLCQHEKGLAMSKEEAMLHIIEHTFVDGTH